MDMMVKLPTRILLIDDHLVVRRGLAELIGSELDCCCTEVANSDECLAALQANSFDLAVLDVSLGQESGFDLVERLNEKEIRIVVYSMFEDAKTIRRALGMGCNAYVSKRESADDRLTPGDEVTAEVGEMICATAPERLFGLDENGRLCCVRREGDQRGQHLI